jgi:hypothetical protein
VWTRGEVGYRAGLMNALLAMLVLQTPWLTSSVFLMATNRHRLVSIGYAVSSVLGLALGVLLAHSHGVVGLVAGLVAAELLVCGWSVPSAACRLVELRPGRYFLGTLGPLLPVAAIVGGAGLLVSGSTESLAPLARVALVGVTVVTTALPATWALWLGQEERRKLRSLLAGAFARSS